MRAKIRKARPRSYTNFSEIGASGLVQWGGILKEEFLPQLRGKEGRKIIKEMSENDSIIGAMLFAISMLIRQAKPKIKPAVEPKTKSIVTQKGRRFRFIKFDAASSEAKDAADFVQSCFEDMSESWADVVSEILTMIPYGWAWLETVYKKRSGASRDPTRNSRFTDGKLGWRKMPLRGQDTLKRWIIDDSGGIQGMVQQITGKPDVTIPIEKSLLFRTVHNKNNPEGRSMLRSAYRSYVFKKRIEEIEGIGIERDLAGLPVLTGPEGLDLWDDKDDEMKHLRQEAETIVRNIRRDEQEGVLKPFGWELELLSSAGKRNFDTTTVIGRYNNNIAMTLLADFIILGHNNRYGSFALSSSKTQMFSVALGGWLESIASVFNRYAIPRLLEVNGMSVENPPVLEFEDIELPDLTELGTYIYRLSQAGFQMFPNIPLEKKLLGAASMPTEDMELGRDPIEHARQMAEAAASAEPKVNPNVAKPNGNTAGTTSQRPTSASNRKNSGGRPMRARVAA